MALFERIRHLIKADAHGVVDALEDEALVLRQCVRDAEAALDRKRVRRAALDAERKRLGAEIEVLDTRLAAFDADVELALAEGQDDLARFTLRRLLPLRRDRAAARARLEAVEREAAELDGAIEADGAALDDLQVRVRERLSRLESSPDGPADVARSVRDEEIELELLRRRRAGGHMASDGIRDGISDGIRDGIRDGIQGGV